MSCFICFEQFPSNELVSPCSKSPGSHTVGTQNTCCQLCLHNYLKSKVESAYEGSCPSLTCLFCKSTPDVKCLISEDHLAQSPGNLYQKYVTLASSLLSIQCSSCHTRTTIFVSTPDKETAATAMSTLRSTIQNYDQFWIDLNSYDQGAISIRLFFDQITSVYCPTLLSERNDRNAFQIMKNILLLIKSSERRANLHLRYLQFRPCVWSLCCNTAMCFKCKTKTFHDGQTCEEVTATMSNEMLPCGQCGVYLVKGDGCDSIICVCGNRFAWSAELKKIRLSTEFSELYPRNTAILCVTVMSSNEFNSEVREKAIAWSRMHKERYDQGPN